MTLEEAIGSSLGCVIPDLGQVHDNDDIKTQFYVQGEK